MRAWVTDHNAIAEARSVTCGPLGRDMDPCAGSSDPAALWRQAPPRAEPVKYGVGSDHRMCKATTFLKAKLAVRCTANEAPHGISMMGIGFGRRHDHQAQGAPDRNPFLNINAEDGPNPERVRRG